jgi:PAS domain S-box-containing protein
VSDDRFRLFAERSPDVIYRVRLSPTLVVEYVSPAAEALTGYAPAEFYADPALWRGLVHPDDRDLVELSLTDPSAIAVPVVARWLRRDGSIVWAEHRSVPVTDDDGAVVALEGSARDVTAQVALLDRLRVSEARIREFLATISVGALMLDANGTVQFINDYLLTVLGRSASEVLGRDWIETVVPGPERTTLRRVFRDAIASGSIEARREDSIVTSTGEVRRLEWTSAMQRDDDGRVIGTSSIAVDVTDARRAAAERAVLATAIEQSAESVMITDPDANITYVNAAFERLSGYPSAEVLGRNPRLLKSGVQSATFYDAMWAALSNGIAWLSDLTNRRKDGSLYYLSSVISPIRAPDGSISGYVSVGRDVGHERELETRAEELARERVLITDTLRRLPSAGTLEASADLFCRQIASLAEIAVTALIIFDADGSAVPIAYVAADGRDAELQRLGPERSRYLREHAETGPWIEAWTNDQSHPYAGAFRAAGVRAFAYAPVLRAGSVIGVLAVGSAEEGAIAQLSGQLGAIVDFADLAGALYGDRVGETRAAVQLRSEIESVIETHAFDPVFQPIVDLRGGQTVGYEALTRFADGVAPDRRFADAAGVGLGSALERATLEDALAAAKSLSPSRFLHLNVSPAFVLAGADLERLVGGSRARLVLEVTEEAAIADYVAFRQAVRSLGRPVRLAVDDAGAGFASLRHILELQPAFIKLDLSLVRGIDADPARQALVAGMRFFARATKRRLIAEGVETEAEAEALRSLDIRLAQGYLLGRPAPARSHSGSAPTDSVDAPPHPGSLAGRRLIGRSELAD